MLFSMLPLVLAMSGPAAPHVQQATQSLPLVVRHSPVTSARAIPAQPPATEADGLLAAALTQAKAEDKYAFLWFSAPW